MDARLHGTKKIPHFLGDNLFRRVEGLVFEGSDACGFSLMDPAFRGWFFLGKELW